MGRVRNFKGKSYIAWLIAGGAASVAVAVDYYQVHDITILGAMVSTFCVLMGLLGLLRNRRR